MRTTTFSSIVAPTHRRTTKRRCRFAVASLHVYRRSLLRRMGLPGDANRPAYLLDTLVQSLLDARVPY